MKQTRISHLQESQLHLSWLICRAEMLDFTADKTATHLLQPRHQEKASSSWGFKGQIILPVALKYEILFSSVT